MAKPRILIAHDYRLFLEGLERLLGREFDVVDKLDAITALPDAVRRLCPDAVVQDLSNTPHVGLEVISQIHESRPATRVVVVTAWTKATLAVDAFRRGASGYILSTSTAAELLAGVRAAMSDAPYISASLAGAVVALLTTTALDQPVEMTHRQREVVQLLARGKSMKEVASALRMSTRTVAFHKYKVMQEFEIKTSAELVRFAVEHGLV